MSDWHCIVNGRQHGPLSLEQIRQWVRDGRVLPGDPVWTDGMGDWTAAGKVPELSSAGAAGPPPAPPGAVLGRRPGGLTALAILNFVFGAGALFARMLRLSAVAESREVTGWFVTRALSESAAPSVNLVYAFYGLGLLVAALEIVAAIGYLGRKKVIGYFVGNAFAVLGIAYDVWAVILFWSVFGSFTLAFSALGFAYAVITLGALNIAYRRQFR